MSNFECLQNRSESDRVSEIQTYLNNWGFPFKPPKPLKVDSIFGQETERAVREFQEYQNLRVDGIVGEKTYKILSTPPPFQPKSLPTLKENVRKLQQSLKKWGFPLASPEPLEIDGIFGLLTQKALFQFQKQAELPKSRLLNPTKRQPLENPSVPLLIDRFNQEDVSPVLTKITLYQLTTTISTDNDLPQDLDNLDLDKLQTLLIEDIASDDREICDLAKKCLEKIKQELQPQQLEKPTNVLVATAIHMNIEKSQKTLRILNASWDDVKEWISKLVSKLRSKKYNR